MATPKSRARIPAAASKSPRTPSYPLGGKLRGVEASQFSILGFLGAAILAIVFLVSSLGGTQRVIAGWPGLRPEVPIDLATYPDAAYENGRLLIPSSTPIRAIESLDGGWLSSELNSATRDEIESLIAASTPLPSADPSASPSAAPSTNDTGSDVVIDALPATRLTWIAGGDDAHTVLDGALAARLRALADDPALRERAVFQPAERLLLVQIDAGPAVESDEKMPARLADLPTRALYRDGYAPFGCTVLEGNTLSGLRTLLAETPRGAGFSADTRRIALFSRPLLAGEPDPCSAGGLDTVPLRDTRLTALRCERLTPDCNGRALAGVTVRAYPIDPDKPESPAKGAEPAVTATSDSNGAIRLELPAGGWVLFFDPPSGEPSLRGPEPGFWLLDLRGQASNPLTVRFGAR